MVYTVSGNVEASSDKSGSVWKGILLSFIASLPFFTHGLETIELSASTHAGHFLPSSEPVPWSATALILSAAVTAPIYCYVIDRYGRKVGLFMVSLVQGASCIPLFLPRDFTDEILLHAAAGVASGGLFTVLPTYIREVTSPGSKGILLGLMAVMTTAGYLMKMAMGFEELMYLMVAMVMVQLLSVLVMIESPCYLVMNGKFESAREAISRLMCLEENNHNLTKELESLKEESERAKSNGKLTLVQMLRNEIYRDGTKLGVTLHTTLVLCGSIIFLDEEKTLQQLKTPADPDRTLVLTCLCAGSLLMLLLVGFIEKKYVITFGFVLMVLSMGVLAVYTQMELTVTSLRWVPVVSLGVLVFGYGIAWAQPYAIMVEVYNFEIRATLIGVIFTYTQIIKLAHIHTIKYIEEYMGIYTVFYVFAFVNLYAAVYSLFAIPDLRGKTARQVERQLKRVPLLKFNTKSLHDK